MPPTRKKHGRAHSTVSRRGKHKKRVASSSTPNSPPSARVYTRKNFMSGDGMMTGVWGPSMWHVLHTMSFNYPVSPTSANKRHFKAFLLSLKNVLPCKHCRTNLKKNFEVLPPTPEHFESRDALSRYVYRLHELVNRMLKKHSGLTYCDVRERYEHFRSRCLANGTLRKRGGPEGSGKGDGEKGCTEPLWGKKSMCVLHIVPKSRGVSSFRMDKTCILRKNGR